MMSAVRKMEGEVILCRDAKLQRSLSWQQEVILSPTTNSLHEGSHDLTMFIKSAEMKVSTFYKTKVLR
jgi:hypothetical protein